MMNFSKILHHAKISLKSEILPRKMSVVIKKTNLSKNFAVYQISKHFDSQHVRGGQKLQI